MFYLVKSKKFLQNRMNNRIVPCPAKELLSRNNDAPKAPAPAPAEKKPEEVVVESRLDKIAAKAKAVAEKVSLN